MFYAKNDSIMLIQFSVRNYKVFKDEVKFSFVASNYDKETREEENVISPNAFDLRLLKSAVIFGANASGKSKFIDALKFMRTFTLNSSKDSQKGDTIDVETFALNTISENDSSLFEVIFIYKKEMFRYGFECSPERIFAEWLYHRMDRKEVEIFYRKGQKFEIHQKRFTKGNTLVKEDLVRDNALMLSVAAQFNDPTAGNVIEWFKGLRSLSGISDEGYRPFTMRKTEDLSYKDKIVKLLKAADLGIEDLKIEKMELTDLPNDLGKSMREILTRKIEENGPIIDIVTLHKKYDSEGNSVDVVEFSLDHEESTGTQKFFSLTGPILHVLEHGLILAVDELDSKLHPNLVCKLVSLFNSTETNPKNAQLIFNTHDTNLLSSGLFRRDQIWFTEKNRLGEATLYSLTDFKTPRKSENFEQNYIRGKYGAVPFLEDFSELVVPKPVAEK
jgi:AAA15 family ATPase/GTPase